MKTKRHAQPKRKQPTPVRVQPVVMPLAAKTEIRPSLNPADVRAALHETTQGTDAGKKLIFDAKSGELMVVGPDAVSELGNVVVDRIYKDGFFAKAA